jgi:hypothetical protein
LGFDSNTVTVKSNNNYSDDDNIRTIVTFRYNDYGDYISVREVNSITVNIEPPPGL